MAKKWFQEVFLPSLEKRMVNPKYPNQCILSSKQAEVCYKHMKAVQHKDASYGNHFYIYEFETESKRYQMRQAGRYSFLSRTCK